MLRKSISNNKRRIIGYIVLSFIILFGFIPNVFAAIATPATPTITRTTPVSMIYGSGDATFTCSTTSTYGSGIDLYYSFGYTESSGGSPDHFTTPTTSNVYVLSSTEYVGQRQYFCRVYASDGTTSSAAAVSSSSVALTINNFKIYFIATTNGGQLSGSGTLYSKYGDNLFYDGLRSTTEGTLPTATMINGFFLGWYTAASGGYKLIDANNVLLANVPGWTDENGKFIITDSTVTVYAVYMTPPSSVSITGGETKIYGSHETVLTCGIYGQDNEEIDVYYAFGYSTSSSGSASNWTEASTTNTLTIADDEYLGQRWYQCRAYATNGVNTTNTTTGSSKAEVAITNFTITFDATTNGGTLSGYSTLYARIGYPTVLLTLTGSNSGTIPTATKANYFFAGWYADTEGTTLVITASGETKPNISGWTDAEGNFTRTEDGTLYANFVSIPVLPTPTLSTGESVSIIYNSNDVILTCETTTGYPPEIETYYSFGYATTDGGTVSNWTGYSTSNTLTISRTEYIGTRYYACRVYISNGSTSSNVKTSTSTRSISIRNFKMTFDASTISGSSTLYSRYGASTPYTGIFNSTTGTFPTATWASYTFLGWYADSTLTTKVINADRTLIANVEDWTNENGKFIRTEDATLYAGFFGIPGTITVSGAETKIYGVSDTVLTCTTSSAVPSEVTLEYSFGYATSSGGSVNSWSNYSTDNTFTVSSTEYVGTRYYACRSRTKYNNQYSSVRTGTANVQVSFKNFQLVFDATTNGGTISGNATLYSRYGSSSVYSSATSSSTSTIPTATKSNYTFTGWYADAAGTTKVINADRTLIANVEDWTNENGKFIRAEDSRLYAGFFGAPATPTISGGETKVYHSHDTTLTCTTATPYPTDVEVYYSFGYATSSSGTVSNWSDYSTSNTLTIGKDEYIGSRYYSCRAYARYNSQNSSVTTGTNKTEMTINYTTIYFSGNGGTVSGNNPLYVKYGTSKLYGLMNSTYTIDISTPPTASKNNSMFVGWYTDTTGATRVIKADKTVITNVPGWTDEDGNFLRTEDSTLYAGYADNPTVTISGGETKIYGSHDTTLTCSVNVTYPSSVQVSYSFGYTEGTNGTPIDSNWGPYSLDNTITIAKDEYVGVRYYSCRVSVTGNGTQYYASQSSLSGSAQVSIYNAKITLDSQTNGGSSYTYDGTSVSNSYRYARYGETGFYSDLTDTTPMIHALVSRKNGHIFIGWYTAASGGIRVIDNGGNFIPNVSGWTNEDGEYIRTSDETLYAQFLSSAGTVTISGGETKIVGSHDTILTCESSIEEIGPGIEFRYTFESTTANGEAPNWNLYGTSVYDLQQANTYTLDKDSVTSHERWYHCRVYVVDVSDTVNNTDYVYSSSSPNSATAVIQNLFQITLDATTNGGTLSSGINPLYSQKGTDIIYDNRVGYVGGTVGLVYKPYANGQKSGSYYLGWYTSPTGGYRVINIDSSIVANVPGWTDENSKFTRTSDGILYAQYVADDEAVTTPTIIGGETKVYGSHDTILTCVVETSIPDAEIQYTFGYKTVDNQSYHDFSDITTSNILVIEEDEYIEQRWYQCRARARSGGGISTSFSSSLGVEVTINNAEMTFDATTNGGTLSGISPLYSKAGTASLYTGIRNDTVGTIPSATINDPEFTFDGWYTDATGGAKVINNAGVVQTSVANWTNENGEFIRTEDSTLYARFVSPTYTISLDSGTDTTSAGTETIYYAYNTSHEIDNETCYYFTNSTLSTCVPDEIITIPEKAHHSFDGYYTEPNGEGIQYIDSTGEIINNLYQQLFNHNTEVTLYANWDIDQITVTLPDDTTETYDYGSTYTLGTNDLAKASVDGGTVTFKYQDGYTSDTEGVVVKSYTPAGWLVNDTEYEDNEVITLTEDIEIEYNYDETKTSPEFPEPEREHYSFEGWYDAIENGELVESYTGDEDINLYAYWTGVEITVTLPDDTEEYYHYGDAYTLGVNNHLKGNDNYKAITFKYQDGETADSIEYVQIAYTPDGWLIDGFPYDDNSVTILTSDIEIDYAYTEEIVNPTFPIPERSGYLFDAWYTNTTWETKVIEDDEILEDITLYAHWIEDVRGNENQCMMVHPDDTVTVINKGETYNLGENTIAKASVDVATVTFRYQDDVTLDTTDKVRRVYIPNGWLVNDNGYANNYAYTCNTDMAIIKPDYSEELASPDFPEPTREHYTFAGWYDGEGEGGDLVYEYAEEEDVTLFARWAGEEITVTYPDGEIDIYSYGEDFTVSVNDNYPDPENGALITFNYNDGETPNSSEYVELYFEPNGWLVNGVHYDDDEYFILTEDIEIEYDYNVTMTNPIFPEPTRDGYLFAGWYDSTTWERIYYETSAIENNITLYARWVEDIRESDSECILVRPNDVLERITIGVPYNLGTNETSKDSEILSTITFKYQDGLTADSTLNVLRVYTPDGWLVNGYSKANNESVTCNAELMRVDPKYTSEVESPIFPEPTREHYTFDGWYDAAESGLEVTTYTGSENINLFAYWAIEEITVTLPDGTEETYDYGDSYTFGTNDTSKASENIATVTFKYQDNETADTTGTVVKSYMPNGWLVGEIEYADGAVLVLTENIELEYNYTETVTNPTFPEPTRTDYMFDGWYTNTDYETKVTEESVITNDINLYAHWIEDIRENENQCIIVKPDETPLLINKGETYNLGENDIARSSEDVATVTFKYQDNETSDTTGKVTRVYTPNAWVVNDTEYADNADYTCNSDMAVIRARYTEELVSPEFPEPTREHYDFDGWFTETSGGSLLTEYTGLEDIDLYAGWTGEDVVVTLPDGLTETYYYGYSYTFGTNDISKENEDIATITFKYQDNETSDTTGTVIKAFISNGWLVGNTEYADGAVLVLTENIELEYNYTEITFNPSFPEPTRTDYMFDGWYTDTNYETKVTENSVITDDTSLYAHWIEDIRENENQCIIVKPDETTVLINKGETYNLGANDVARLSDDVATVTFKYQDNETSDTTGKVTRTYTPYAWLVNDTEYADNADYTCDTDMAVIRANYIEELTSPAFPEPTRDNYDFDGWYTAPTGGEEVTEYTGLIDINLYAYWTILAPTDFDVDSNELTILVGGTHQIVPTFIPAGTTDTLVYTEYDNEVVSVVDGLITGLAAGETTIKVSLTSDNTIYKTISVTVLSNELLSGSLSVQTMPLGRIVIGEEPQTALEDFLSKINNPSEYIKVYDMNDELVEDTTEFAKTGMKIKLVINNEVIDEAYVVVRGDLDGDGYVDASDGIIHQNIILEKPEYDGYKLDYRAYAADLDYDPNETEEIIIDATDGNILDNKILEKIDSLNH